MRNEMRLKVDSTALVLVVLLFAEHLLFGGDQLAFSLAFAVAELAFLVVLMAASRGAEPPRLPLTGPAVLLAAVYAIGLFSILPVGPPLAHPLWAYVQKIEPGVAATVSMDPAATRLQLVKLTGYAAMFLIGASLGGRRDSAEQTLRYLIVAGILYSLWALSAYAISPKSVFGTPNMYGGGRLIGSFTGANTAGTLFASLAIIALADVLRPLLRIRRSGERIDKDELWRQWPAMALGLLALSGLFLTASRGGLLAMAVAILCILGLGVWIKSAKSNLTGGFVGAVCLILAAVLILFLLGGRQVAERLSGTNLDDRRLFLAAYWPTIKASPWLGYGLGAFRSVNAVSMNSQNAVALAGGGAAHSVYLQWLLQQGWPGALAMFGAVGLVMAATVRGVVRRASQQSIGLACVGVGVVFAVHGLVDFAFEIPSMAAFFSAILGLGYGLAERPAGGGR